MGFKQFLTVTFQTFKIKIKTKSYWALLIAPLLLISFVIGFNYLVNNNSTNNIGIVNNRQMYDQFQSNKINVSNIDKKNAHRYLSEKKIVAYVVTNKNQYSVYGDANTSSSTIDSINANLKQFSTIQNMQRANLSRKQVEILSGGKQIELHINNKNSSNNSNFEVVSILGIFVFIFLTSYVSMIGQEIANEKSSRIMEILLSVTSAKIQYFGKIAGIFCLALVQFIVYAIFIALGIHFGKYTVLKDQIQSVTGKIDANVLLISAVIILSSIALYVFLTAIIASLINDYNQVQQAVAPVTYIAMVGYILTFMLPTLKDNTIVKILSFIPYFSQILMPARMSIHLASYTDGMVVILINVITLIIIAHWGLRLYQKNVLSYSSTNVMKQFLLSVLKK